jgi:universal stress protein E
VIAQLAAGRQAELVAMGTTGRSGLPYILIGSVAEKTLPAVPCDILVVRPHGFHFELP